MDKFEFGIDFQWEILRYTLNDINGYKTLQLYKFTYFDLDDQQIIARAIIRFFKRRQRIPYEASILNEEIRQLFKSKDYAQNLTALDRKRIQKRVRRLYRRNAKDGDEILEKCKNFASFVEMKKVLEEVDPTDFNRYGTYVKKMQSAINIGKEFLDKKGTFLVGAHQSRFYERQMFDEVRPTPFRQMNRLTNANGYPKNSVVVVLDKPKGGKTAFLINCAKLYMKGMGNFKVNARRKLRRVIYFDLENGETAITTRLDQSIIGKTKREVLTGEYDQKLKKLYRAYKRNGGEIFVVRLPNLSTVDDFQSIMDDIYNEYGINFDVAIIDYIALMGALSGVRDDEPRISQAYLDVKNWAKANDLDIVFTGHHVVRKAYKRRVSKWNPDDTAKCIEINRHVDAMWGIQQSILEEKAGVIRLELIEQRDGEPYGNVFFHWDLRNQRIIEFTETEIKTYREKYTKQRGDM